MSKKKNRSRWTIWAWSGKRRNPAEEIMGKKWYAVTESGKPPQRFIQIFRSCWDRSNRYVASQTGKGSVNKLAVAALRNSEVSDSLWRGFLLASQHPPVAVHPPSDVLSDLHRSDMCDPSLAEGHGSDMHTQTQDRSTCFTPDPVSDSTAQHGTRKHGGTWDPGHGLRAAVLFQTSSWVQWVFPFPPPLCSVACSTPCYTLSRGTPSSPFFSLRTRTLPSLLSSGVLWPGDSALVLALRTAEPDGSGVLVNHPKAQSPGMVEVTNVLEGNVGERDKTTSPASQVPATPDASLPTSSVCSGSGLPQDARLVPDDVYMHSFSFAFKFGFGTRDQHRVEFWWQCDAHQSECIMSIEPLSPTTFIGKTGIGIIWRSRRHAVWAVTKFLLVLGFVALLAIQRSPVVNYSTEEGVDIFKRSRLQQFPVVRMSASWFLVSMYLIWIFGSKLIRSNNQSRATLWVLKNVSHCGTPSL